ncbi:P-loop ATPase-like protein [Stappia sp. 22II-S9-Z10]|nr:P-loop ATPase-like protein [Stappia sp. 22II-S9-Z10]
MNRRDDTDEIDAALRSRIKEVLDTFAPGWMEHRGKGYPNATSMQDLGSFGVTLSGKHQGGWYRFSQRLGGGPVKLIAYLMSGQAGEPSKEDYRIAFEEARRFLGMDWNGEAVNDEAVRAAQAKAKATRERARAKAEAEAEEDRLRRQERADALFDHAEPIHGTAAETYLLRRDVPVPEGGWPETLRFAREVFHPFQKRWFPALLARVDDALGDLCGVQRIFITLEGSKAPVPAKEVKLGLGQTSGGAVRLGAPIDGWIGIAEGVETALSVMAMPAMDLPVWATLGTAMASFEAPMNVRGVRIFADHDQPKRTPGTLDFRPGPNFKPPAGIIAAQTLADRLNADGIECVIDQSAPRRGADYNDILRAVARARAAIAARQNKGRVF